MGDQVHISVYDLEDEVLISGNKELFLPGEDRYGCFAWGEFVKRNALDAVPVFRRVLDSNKGLIVRLSFYNLDGDKFFPEFGLFGKLKEMKNIHNIRFDSYIDKA